MACGTFRHEKPWQTRAKSLLIRQRRRLGGSLYFADFGLSFANHTAKVVSANELFALVSDIAVQHPCAARLVPAITTRCRLPLFRRWQLPGAVSCRHLTRSFAFTQTTLGIPLRQRQMVHMLRG